MARLRVARLALLDTSARPDTPEQTQRRQAQIALARSGRLASSRRSAAGSTRGPGSAPSPGARLLVVAGAGHLTPLERPEQVTNALVAWL